MLFEEIRAKGLERYVVDRSTHPGYYASKWPILGRGIQSLGPGIQHRVQSLAYNSILIVVMSNHWAEGGWWRLQNMLRYTEEAGYLVALEEVDDMSLLPTDAIGIMRACGAMLALDAGFEWCLMVDTDVHLEEDSLVKLLKHDRPVVYPLLEAIEDPWGGPLCSPRLDPNTGLQPVLWAAMSCMLFNTKVFNCLAPYAWHGHDYHFTQNLAHFGHRTLVDTDTLVHVTQGPSRHVAKDWDRLWADMKIGYGHRRDDDRHREPPPGFDPAFDPGTVDEKGVYWGLDEWKYMGIQGPTYQEKLKDLEQQNATD